MTTSAKRFLIDIHFVLGDEPMTEVYSEYIYRESHPEGKPVEFTMARDIMEWAYEQSRSDVISRMASLGGQYRHLTEAWAPTYRCHQIWW